MASRTENVSQSVQRARQLDFSKAMSDFKVMFPSFDYEVIEMVLRANNGLVDATVDQLLAMQAETNDPEDNGLLDPELNVRLPSYSDTGATTYEPPPAYTPRVDDEQNISYDSTFLDEHLSNFNGRTPSQNTPAVRKNNSVWHPPLVGTLPQDFLRISLDDTGSPDSERIHSSCTENPFYESADLSRSDWVGTPVDTPRSSQVARPNIDTRQTDTAVSRPTVNGYDQGFNSVPGQEDEAKSCGKKGKSKKFGQMSRKFKRKKTKNTKGTTYQQMSGNNLLDELSGDERDAQR